MANNHNKAKGHNKGRKKVKEGNIHSEENFPGQANEKPVATVRLVRTQVKGAVSEPTKHKGASSAYVKEHKRNWRPHIGTQAGKPHIGRGKNESNQRRLFKKDLKRLKERTELDHDQLARFLDVARTILVSKKSKNGSLPD